VETVTGVLDQNIWQHLCFTYDGSTNASGLNMYVDGTNRPTDNVVEDSLNATISNSDDLELGLTTGGIVNVTFDEFSMWDKELTSAEVTEIYNGGSPTILTSHSASANLEGWWRMGDGTGDTVDAIVDQSTNSNDGTMIGPGTHSLSTDTPGASGNSPSFSTDVPSVTVPGPCD